MGIRHSAVATIVCRVGCIPIASVITPISSPMYVISACPPNLSFSDPFSLSSAALTVLLPTLPHVSEISPLYASLTFSVVSTGLLASPAVVEEADIVCPCLPAERCVQVVASAGAVSFGVKLYADFSSVYSIRAHDSVPVSLTEELPESFNHPKV